MNTSNPTVWLTVHAHNAPKLILYFVDTFGFVVTARYGTGATVDHAELRWPEGSGGIMLGSYRPGVPLSRPPGTASAFVATSDLDGVYRRVLDRRADIVVPLARTDYGARAFAVRDPEGNLWCFSDHGGEPAQ